MIVLSQATPHEPPNSASARDNIEMAEAARLAGCRIYYLPKDFTDCETAENALWYVPEQEQPTLAIWSGFIPSRDRHDAPLLAMTRLSQSALLMVPNDVFPSSASAWSDLK